MIINERLLTYLEMFSEENTGILKELEAEAIKARVPVIRPGTQDFLRLLLSMKEPGKILEIGTAVGFSAIFMLKNNPVKCHITTIENYEKRIPIAKENFKRAAAEQAITLLEGDAREILTTLKNSYDFIFLDAAKGQYPIFLPELVRLLKPGGTLVCDNVLQEGEMLESRFIVLRRNRTIHKRMRQFLFEITHHKMLTTSVLPVGDGMTVSSKRQMEKTKV